MRRRSPRGRRPGRRAGLGLLVVGALLGIAPGAVAATADCGGGDIELLQGVDVATVVGARITGIGEACDGQPVGVQFLGNAEGDPSAPATELSHAYSDEDACTGEERPDGVLRDGTVDVLLCEESTSSPFVDGRQLTGLRLLTTAGTSPVVPPPTPPGDPGDGPLPAPVPPDAAPEPTGDDLPMTGAEVLQALVLGGVLVLVGGGLLRRSRSTGS